MKDKLPPPQLFKALDDRPFPLTQSNAYAVAICVPVRNEEALLPLLLDGLARQERGGIAPVICLLLDGCTDGSEAIAQRAAIDHPLAVRIGRSDGHAPLAGRARRAAMALGMAAVGDRGDALLLTTDADSIPAPDWLSRSCAALRDADVVTGRVVRGASPSLPVQDRIESYLDALYRLRRRIDPLPWEVAPMHHFTGAASLGFRATAYNALGGFEEIATSEDARIVDAARRLGLRVRHDARIVVETSSRRIGRATRGLADHLDTLARAGDTAGITMIHPADEVWRYRAHASARRAFAALDEHAEALAMHIGTSIADVRQVAARSANAEAFATVLVPPVPTGERRIGLAEAERALNEIRSSLELRAA